MDKYGLILNIGFCVGFIIAYMNFFFILAVHEFIEGRKLLFFDKDFIVKYHVFKNSFYKELKKRDKKEVSLKKVFFGGNRE